MVKGATLRRRHLQSAGQRSFLARLQPGKAVAKPRQKPKAAPAPVAARRAPDSSDAEQAAEAARQLQQSVEQPVEFGSSPFISEEESVAADSDIFLASNWRWNRRSRWLPNRREHRRRLL